MRAGTPESENETSIASAAPVIPSQRVKKISAGAMA